jgi:hypothetical protein
MNMTGFARMATPIHPIMDNLWMDTFFFFVPNRLVWDNWAKFNGEQTNPGDSTDFTIPILSSFTPTTYGSILDHMGMAMEVANNNVNALPFRCLNLIWNEWFRDQNLQNSRPINTDDGPDVFSDYTKLTRGKRHDYFTSCLPWPQKGDGVDIPLGTSAPIYGDKNAGADVHIGDGLGSFQNLNSTAVATPIVIGNPSAGPANLYADLTNATAATINQLRQAFQIQRLLERDARGGTRYTEIIRAHFGVTSPDARLQRPEYLGGGTSPVQISAVPQTSQTEATGTAQGNLAAYGTAQLHGHGFTKSFTEHGYIIGLANVRADLTYQQGRARMWDRRTRYDFYWPALSHIGEQAVLNKEIYVSGTASPDDDVFGYQERYAEYRYHPSRITGLFRSSYSQSLDPWHLSQDFASLPVLNDTFITENPPVDRVVAVTGDAHFLFDAYFSLRCARPMPLYGVPGMIDHF